MKTLAAHMDTKHHTTLTVKQGSGGAVHVRASIDHEDVQAEVNVVMSPAEWDAFLKDLDEND